MKLPTLDPTLEYDIVSSIINAVGRDVTLTYVETRSECPVCAGSDPFCPTCHGNPTVDVTQTKVVCANIIWKGSDRKLYRPEGQFVEGDCLIDFMVDVISAYESTDVFLKTVTTVTVDGRICVIDRWYYEGSPINRVSLVLSQDDNVGGQRIG